MAIDPRQLRPSDLCRLLNSTPLGEVINERQLYRHRTRAGFRIGDGRHVDLFRYVAWLVQLRHEPKPESEERPVRNAQGTRPGAQRGAVPGRPGHRRAAGGCQSGAEGLRTIAISGSSASRTSRRRFICPGRQDHLKVIAQDRAGGAARRPVCHGHAARAAARPRCASVACIWAVLVRPPRLRLPDRHRRRPCDGHARVDQDRTGRQRPAAGGLPGGRLSDPASGRDRQPLQRATLQGRADAHRLDRQGDRAADDARAVQPAVRSSRSPASPGGSAA